MFDFQLVNTILLFGSELTSISKPYFYVTVRAITKIQLKRIFND